jgi:hypothetical protein
LPARGAARSRSVAARINVPVVPSCANLRASALESVATVVRRADVMAVWGGTVVPIATILPVVPAAILGL